MPITVLIAIALLIVLWLFLSQKRPVFTDILARFWSKPKYYPTKEDIARKYPKAKHLQQQSLERKRREAREKERLEAEQKQAVIDRHLKELKSGRESKLETARKLDILHEDFRTNNKQTDQPAQKRDTNKQTFQPVQKRDISASKFRKLIKMVNGREDVARRLIDGNLKLFPDKSPDWACDKAISDVERDRR